MTYIVTQGDEEGSLYVSVSPCDAKGKSLDEESFIEEPSELLNKPYYFKVSLLLAGDPDVLLTCV